MRKRLLLIGFVFAGLCLFGQEPSHEGAAKQAAQEDEQPDLMKWKLINTGIFAALLAFGVIKVAPKFFAARSLSIQKAIKDATGLKMEADLRYSEIDKKMANLPAEVERLKAKARAEMQQQQERMQDETAAEMRHIERNAEAEIDSLRKEGAQNVKRHTAELALALAERRLQSRFAQPDSQNNIAEFVQLVSGGKN